MNRLNMFLTDMFAGIELKEDHYDNTIKDLREGLV